MFKISMTDLLQESHFIKIENFKNQTSHVKFKNQKLTILQIQL